MARKKYLKPRFIELKGCINCDTVKACRAKYGKDYVFDHELMAACLIHGCTVHGVSLSSPFMDPDEVVAKAAKDYPNDPVIQANAKNYSDNIKRQFWPYYPTAPRTVRRV